MSGAPATRPVDHGDMPTRRILVPQHVLYQDVCLQACLEQNARFLTYISTVLAITKDNIDTLPTLFNTSDTSAGLGGCTIWQVARATSAATTFFKPIKLGRDEIEFVDAGFGYNNPCEVLIDEAKRQFPGREQMQVLSIGTGLGDVVTIGKTRISIIKALKKMATSSKRVATTLQSRHGESDLYCRFNVEQGLQDVTLSDWEKSSTISAHTHNYLAENTRKITAFVNSFISINQGGNTKNSAGLPSNATEDESPVPQTPTDRDGSGIC